MAEYLIGRASGSAARIDRYPWGGGYRPAAEFSLAYGADALFLALRAWEQPAHLRAYARGLSRDVWHDSCLESFLMPMPERDKRYVNLECNPKGAIYLGIGTGRDDNIFLENEDVSELPIAPFREDAPGGLVLWGVTARLPLALLRRFFPGLHFAPGGRMRANFYKCGEKTPAPHYACWSFVNAPAPDFHRPECFGSLTFV